MTSSIASTTTSVTSSSTSSSTGTGGGCPTLEKRCSGQCVAEDDPAHGCDAVTCGSACSLPHVQTQACANEACAVGQCVADYMDCNGSPTDGCEVDIKTDAGHCGSCGKACNLANTTQSCVNGACAVGTCATGFKDCNTDPSDGCEVNVTNTKAHCGSCGHACTNAHDACTASACITPCGALPNLTGDFLCWLYTGPADPNLGYVGLRGGINQDPDPFDNSSGCINQVMGEPFVLCDLGTPAPTDTILAMAGIHSGNTQFSATVAGTFACTATACQGTIIGYKAGVECGSAVNGVLSSGPNCLSFILDAGTHVLDVKFAP
ncbi:MAG: hypothetical protein WA001_03135 [Patescibacteria group bacterium]